MTIYRALPKCMFGFRQGDVVMTPTHRRAVLTRYRDDDARWNARYVTAIDGGLGEETILHPKFLRHANES